MPDPQQAAAHGVRTSGVIAPQVTRPILEELARLIQDGALVAPVGQVFSFSDVADAHALSQTGHGRGRVILQVSG
jgi:NADPH:quinone reductase-like Zn-dependent oxidoreductase